MSSTFANDHVRQSTRGIGLERLQQVQQILGSTQQEVYYMLDSHQSAESDADRARIMGYCIEFILPFLTNNLHVDLLAQRQAELLVLVLAKS
jgi:hypothetical protein